MPEESLRIAIDGIVRRLHDDIEAQLQEVAARHREELESTRRSAEAEAEQRWSAKVEDVRGEWTARLESEMAAARSEGERRMVAEAMRLRADAEQAAAQSSLRARQELEQALDNERTRAEQQIAEERQRIGEERQQLADERQRWDNEREQRQRELDDLRERLSRAERELEAVAGARAQAESALDEERRGRREEAQRLEESAAASAEARVAERQSQLAVVERLLSGIRSLDTGRSLSQVLSALLSSAAAEAPRVALFVVNGPELKTWKAQGFGADDVVPGGTDDQGLLATVMRQGDVVTTSESGPPPPAFAHLPADRAAIAVPLLVGAQPVAILYADDASDSPAQAPASWPEAIQILCRYAAVNLAHLTAARTAEAMRRSLSPASAGAAANRASQTAPADDSNSARRYARLLVSEIKLYNEPAVRIGRENRDLLTRLKPEIERARRLYEQRISSSVDSRGALFQQELVQTLADGDPALLGGSA